MQGKCGCRQCLIVKLYFAGKLGNHYDTWVAPTTPIVPQVERNGDRGEIEIETKQVLDEGACLVESDSGEDGEASLSPVEGEWTWSAPPQPSAPPAEITTIAQEN